MKPLSLLSALRSVMLALAMVSGLAIGMVPAYAVNPDEILDDPVLEERARHISAGLRCLVCQNQSIDDSDAPLARDLRILVRERLVAGDSDAEAREFLVSRYGEFVLLKPTFSAKNVILWAFGPLVLLFGLFAIHRLYRNNKQVAQTSAAKGSDQLSEAEQTKLKKILSE
ncbi:cytochrome c-type biogenesis protein CcmH [Cohaesibacter sp. CAU 1516]|uniref:cytochrome c-type biogenesis protein n=1 Tax=Cohaesibacter sp. CAU 1516 TaxID=2576038 RepID=UPI0010FDB82B|nr:cytochrome c-type biogenesis protein [Cohaesibacter sp. CAU 1516]TLP44805.1 cytochrome c-type biogenesis protein CcmH [Cohaesibacter sp. CAU 1516]